MVGSWKINVSTGAMPEKVATAVSALNEMVGAEYKPIAYLGSQVVNGINHAVLCEQTVITGKDTKNVVVAIFNEKPEDLKLTLVAIERVVESGAPLGGIVVDATTDIPAEAKAAFDAQFEAFVGSKVEPFAYLGSQVVNGINYIFAATVTPVTQEPVVSAAIVIVNNTTGEVSFTDILDTKCDSLTLGYAFTWLKRQNTALGAPLGEWP